MRCKVKLNPYMIQHMLPKDGFEVALAKTKLFANRLMHCNMSFSMTKLHICKRQFKPKCDYSNIMKPCKFWNVNVRILENGQQIQKDLVIKTFWLTFKSVFVDWGRTLSHWWSPSHMVKWLHGIFLTNPSLNPLDMIKQQTIGKIFNVCIQPNYFLKKILPI
jgi:hypothetical protein